MIDEPNEASAGPTHEDVRHVCGDIADWKVAAILATGASLDEIEVAVSDEEGSIEFPLPEELAPKVAERLGQEVVLGLRPEIITHPGAHAPGSSVFDFERSIDVIEPTGPDTLVVFTLGGSEAIGRVRPDEAVEASKPYRFQVNMDKAKLFHPESGNRL